ncbi:MAG: CBS domain-containing protein, partial [Bacteroidota bacterium]
VHVFAGALLDHIHVAIEQRARKHMNGARWQLRAYTKFLEETTHDEALTALTACIVSNQKKEIPVHEWPMPDLKDLPEYRPSKLKVSEFMETDLFTVQKDDILELVAEMMDWRKIRYAPVENTKGELSGLITSRLLLRHFISKRQLKEEDASTVKDIMIQNPMTIGPNATILEAMNIMRDRAIGCLPVVQGKELIGIITEMDFLRISGRLMERLEND